MNNVAKVWASVRKWTLADWAWRLSFLLLPWQTRWFAEGINLGGYPWEQSRLSLYIVWLPMLVTMFLACRLKHLSWKSGKKYLWLIGLLLVSCFTIYPIATVQWWIQIGFIGLWLWAIQVLNPKKDELMSWLVIGLIPHALLACAQAMTNVVWGSKWLGIASQLPATPGVSVVLKAGERILRAYGGFPHPNILGGWMALASIMTVQLAASESHHEHKTTWIVIGSLCFIALTLSYSRSAWLMALLGFALLTWQWYRAKASMAHWQALAYLGLVFACALVATSPTWLARVQANDRLEQKSVTERTDAFTQAWEVGKSRWLIGSGAATSLFALAPKTPDQIPIPPHNVFLMIWLEMGVIGVGLIGYAIYAHRKVFQDPFWLLILLPAFAFDHYLWSLWPGQVLLGIALLMACLKPVDHPKATA